MTGGTVTQRPTVVSGGVATAAAVVALVVGASGSGDGLAIGLLGTALVAVGIGLASRTAVDLGCLVLFFGVVAAGIQGAPVERTLIGTVATVFAWDLAQGSIELGDQLGREADTRRLEVVHAGSSLLVGLSSVLLGYGVYVFAADGQPASAVALSLVAALLVTIGLGASRRRWGSARR